MLVFFAIQSRQSATKEGQDKTHDALKEIDQKVDGMLGDEYSRDAIIKKTVVEREDELEGALDLLSDAIIKVQNGNHNYLKILAGQLRALLCFKTGVLSPLLLDLADEKDVPLECYARTFRHMIEVLGGTKNMQLAVNPGRIVSIEKIDTPTARKYLFKNWLGEPVMVLAEESYTPTEIIRMVAEKQGGISYSDYLPEKLIEGKKLIWTKSGREYDQIENILMQTAEVTIDFGKVLLNEKVN